MIRNVTLEPNAEGYFKKNVPYVLIAAELAIAGLLGFALMLLGADGSSWILGGIVAGAAVVYLYHSRYKVQAKPNRSARKLGQMLIGLTVGFSIQHSDLASLSNALPIFVFSSLFLVSSGSLIGYIYSQLEKTDVLTAMLATVPGNVGIMASIAADYGRSAPLVSLVQLMRFTSVTFVIPLAVNALTDTAPIHDVSQTLHSLVGGWSGLDWTYGALLGLVLGLAAIAVKMGSQVRIPVAAFLCSIAVGFAFNALLRIVPFLPSVDFSLPPLFNLVGQILLGITIGEYWGVSPTLSRGTVVRSLIPVGLIGLVGLISAGIAMLVTPWDWLTCVLVTAPGGSPEMIWIALALNHDVEVVTAGHLIRLVAINVSLPALVALGLYLEKRPHRIPSPSTPTN